MTSPANESSTEDLDVKPAGVPADEFPEGDLASQEDPGAPDEATEVEN